MSPPSEKVRGTRPPCPPPNCTHTLKHGQHKVALDLLIFASQSTTAGSLAFCYFTFISCIHRPWTPKNLSVHPVGNHWFSSFQIATLLLLLLQTRFDHSDQKVRCVKKPQEAGKGHGTGERTVAKQVSIGGALRFCGDLDIIKLTNTPLIYSFSRFNLEGLGALFGGLSRPTPPPVATGLARATSQIVIAPALVMNFKPSSSSDPSDFNLSSGSRQNAHLRLRSPGLTSPSSHLPSHSYLNRCRPS